MMGTNFYWKQGGEHIGKRSAAGWYCYDCRVTLCAGGERRIHYGDSYMLDACPQCGREKPKHGDHYNSAAVELGFARAPTTPTNLTGVQTASSFSWAQEPEYVMGRLKHRAKVLDEYGRTLTAQEFRDMLDSVCPIRFTDSIGHEFS